MTKDNIKDLEQWSFCDNQKDCDELFDLATKGIKTATSYIYEGQSESSNLSILTNWDKSKKVLLKTLSVKILKFKDVNEEMAYKEGEGDRSLKYWQKVHRIFFSKYCSSFNDETLICYEEFEIIQNIED